MTSSKLADSNTWSHDAVTVGESDDLPHLGKGGVLHQDEDGRDLVGEHVGVARGGQVLAGKGDDVQTGGELVKEAWVT